MNDAGKGNLITLPWIALREEGQEAALLAAELTSVSMQDHKRTEKHQRTFQED